MQRRAKLFEMPEIAAGDLLFALKEITYTPEAPRMKQPFTVKGKVELLKIPFLAPIWVTVKVLYPSEWWEEIIPIIGSPTVSETDMVIGGDFEITFPRGFDREGEFLLAVEVYAGPTVAVDTMTLPPFPPVTKEETTFLVAGEVPPEEVGFREFRILSYSKNGGPPVTPPGVLELDVGDRCRVNVGFDHMNGAVTGKFHAAIGNLHHVPVEWFDEVGPPGEKTFTVPASPDWVPIEDSIDIVITTAISPGTYSMYVKIMGITGGDIFTEYLENVITIIGPPGLGFELTKPTVSQTPVDPGTAITITCPVTSTCTSEQTATAKVKIYEGSIFPGHGALITTKTSPAFSIAPGQTYNIIVHHTTIVGTIDRRDVEVGIYVNTQLIKESEWDDVYYVSRPPEIPTSDIGPLDRFAVVKGTYDLGDSVPWTLPYAYKGKAQSGWLTISLGTGVYPSFFTKHTFPRIAVSFQEAYEWTEFYESGSFTLPTALELGQTYSVRAKLETADGKQETDTDWSAFTIRPGPPTSDIRNFDFKAAAGTYDLGDSVPFDAPYEYKGKAQGGWLTISLGTGVSPSFFTKHTFSRIRVNFDEAMDWASGRLTGSFTLPATLELGQTYSVRAKLETDDGKQETDTDWSAFNITAPPEMLEVRINPYGAGYVTVTPEPESGTEHNWYFPYGTTVYVTAHPYPGYRFKSWSGEMTDTAAITAPVYPMTEHRLITAHFEPEIELETLEVRIDPYGAGYVTTSPAPAGGVQHNWQFPHGTTVYVTAHANPGYVFKSWSGEMKDTTAITAPVYPMTEHRLITAHFKEEYVPPPPVEGIFFVTPYNEPIDYVEWCVEWAPDTGPHYLSEWRGKGFMVVVKDPITDGNVPLVGKMYAWLWPGYGTATRYGPTPRYTLADGKLYEFNIGYNTLYEK